MRSLLSFALLFTLLLVPALVSGQAGTVLAVADTVDLVPGPPVTFDLLANDMIAPYDTIRTIKIVLGDITCRVGHGSRWTFRFSTPHFTGTRVVTGSYRLQTMSGDTSRAPLVVRVHEEGFGYLDINNVSARFSAYGTHVKEPYGFFEVPKGSGKISVFSNSLWISALDEQQSLHVAAAKYGYGVGGSWRNDDFFVGPVMDSLAYSVAQDTLWDRVWNLKKSDIDYHRAHCWDAGYTPIRDILTWPGNGDTALGQARQLAPFSDRNGDGRYDPFDGDYPEIRGDQALWFVFNDDRSPHTEAYGKKLKIEIQGMAYAYDMPGDTAFKNTVFLNYRIFNRSQNTYDSTLFGIFTDIDLGYQNDDFTGCDVGRGMCYNYNGNPADGTGQARAYGAYPPAQSVTLLGGPLLEPDGIDNPRYDNTGTRICDAGVNGLHFGDSVVDNERMGLQGYMVPLSYNIVNLLMDPNNAEGYYRVLNCRFIYYGTHLTYGGYGHPAYGGYGPECRFMFPGESDTLFWGSGCTQPNGPVDWTAENSGFYPSDIKGTPITGPVTFHPGDMKELDIAFSWARDYNNPDPHASLGKLRQVTDRIRTSFESNTLPGGGPIYGTGDKTVPGGPALRIYPNPASDYFTVDFGNGNATGDITLDLLTSQGTCVKHVTVAGGSRTARFSVTGLPAGIYVLCVRSDQSGGRGMVVVMEDK